MKQTTPPILYKMYLYRWRWRSINVQGPEGDAKLAGAPNFFHLISSSYHLFYDEIFLIHHKSKSFAVIQKKLKGK